LALLVTVYLWAAEQPVSGAGHQTLIASEKTANIVAESAIPFSPAVSDEASHLVKTGGVPGLGNKLRPREHRIRLDIPQHRRARQQIARLVPRQDRREIEAEAVDVHLFHPIVETIHDHPADNGMI